MSGQNEVFPAIARFEKVMAIARFKVVLIFVVQNALLLAIPRFEETYLALQRFEINLFFFLSETIKSVFLYLIFLILLI